MHSMNYRSAVVLGSAVPVVDLDERLRALEAIIEHTLAGRWREVRPPTERELRETAVLRLALAEASAKARSGPPLDADADLFRGCWAGEIPLRLVALPAVADPRLAAGIEPPASIMTYRRKEKR